MLLFRHFRTTYFLIVCNETVKNELAVSLISVVYINMNSVLVVVFSKPAGLNNESIGHQGKSWNKSAETMEILRIGSVTRFQDFWKL